MSPRQFEHIILFVLTLLMAVIIVSAVWNLTLRIVFGLVAMLAIVRKLIILDLKGTEAAELFGLAATMLALGAVYWAVRDQDRKDRVDRPAAGG